MSEVSTAILLFTRTAQEEAVAKSWSGRARNRQIAKLLIRNSKKVLQASGMPYIIHEHQQGNSFGEKLAFAFQKTFDQGYEQVICVGNDCPDLHEGSLQKAAKKLSNGQEWVLGPSEDGGVYLIGMNKNCFEQLNFEAISWHSKRVFSELKAILCNKKLTGYTLPVQQDLDNALDLAEILNRVFRQQVFTKALLQIFEEKPFSSFYIPHFSLDKEIPLLAGVFRGPPRG